MQTANVKNARVEFKTTQNIKALLQEASSAVGLDLSSFLISVATKEAKKILNEERFLKLNNQEWQNFENILNNPTKPTKELKNLMKLEDFNE
jgi:uncharacterized protein (DUF1778 family)